MSNFYSVWNQIFWTIFIGLGLILLLLTKFNSFLMVGLVGLVIIVLGIQKFVDERSFRYLHHRQGKMEKKLTKISTFLDNTYKKVDLTEDSEKPSLGASEEIKKEVDESIERLAKKMIQIENKVNQISKGIVENWGRMQEEQLIETSKPKVKQATKSTGRILESNNELKEKLKKAMGG